MSKKTLLLNASYEVLSFISERKVFKLLCKEDKVEVISNWQDIIKWGKDTIKHPSILRLKNHIKRNFFNCHFSRKALIKRDKSYCQYCQKKLSACQLTIDHVLPKSKGGITSFTNCVVCCHECNGKKADRTPEQAGMVLLKKPTHPSFNCYTNIEDSQEYWNDDWDDFLTHT
jgi:hypothetical protein